MIEYAVGIDPGYAACAAALLRKEGQVWAVERVWETKTPARMPFAERLHTVFQDLRAALWALRGKSFLQGIRVVVACEAQERAQEGNRQRGTTNDSALRVQQVVGMVRALCFELNFTLIEPTTAQVKAVIGGIPRDATKAQVTRAVRALVKGCTDKMSEHMSDAIATGIAGARLSHQKQVEKAMRRR